MSKIRKPKINQGQQVTVSSEQLSSDTIIDYPVFCFKHLQNGYAISDCTDEQKIKFLERLHKLSSMTWNDIKLAPRHGLGTEKINKSALHHGMPSFISDDVDFLLAFRCFGLMPFLGHRNGSILHIVFIDPSGSVYDHS